MNGFHPALALLLDKENSSIFQAESNCKCISSTSEKALMIHGDPLLLKWTAKGNLLPLIGGGMSTDVTKERSCSP